MAETNGAYDWRERMERLEAHAEQTDKNLDRVERNINLLHQSMQEQKTNVDKLLGALRDLTDRIPLKI
jgi:hypothetical protein